MPPVPPGAFLLPVMPTSSTGVPEPQQAGVLPGAGVPAAARYDLHDLVVSSPTLSFYLLLNLE